MAIDISLLEELYQNSCRALVSVRRAEGHWEGELSSSALSTATASFTLTLLQQAGGGSTRHGALITNGLDWLRKTQNPDGGWGDTVLSISNISTTALCWGALKAYVSEKRFNDCAQKAEAWLTRSAGTLRADGMADAIVRRYGTDHTFSVPILTMLALSGRLGEDAAVWDRIPQLPFELAALPFRWFQWIHLPVVSYALPALIAIGQVHHVKRPTTNSLLRGIRDRVRQKTLRVLESIQPTSGGFLEATPLTSFVSMSLIAAGNVESPIVLKGIEFLERSVRSDGSWPIDTNLATWVTTLSINALGGETLSGSFGAEERAQIRWWLLEQQYTTEHPYTHAPAGGWAWTDLPGGVPDADDTPGALLALRNLGEPNEKVLQAVRLGVEWLINLQNSDGGMPTFCRGWGTLPFDRSSADLTAHAILAWSAWRGRLEGALQRRLDRSIRRGLRFLSSRQTSDGAWAPLWFGNQHLKTVENLTYGTSRVCRLLGICETADLSDGVWQDRLRNGIRWLQRSQNTDGGWGGGEKTPSSIEETAWALEALGRGLKDETLEADRQGLQDAVRRGLKWLDAKTQRGRRFDPAPIGFYFANLWYYEKLYPKIFTVAALASVRDSFSKAR